MPIRVGCERSEGPNLCPRIYLDEQGRGKLIKEVVIQLPGSVIGRLPIGTHGKHLGTTIGYQKAPQTTIKISVGDKTLKTS